MSDVELDFGDGVSTASFYGGEVMDKQEITSVNNKLSDFFEKVSKGSVKEHKVDDKEVEDDSPSKKKSDKDSLVSDEVLADIEESEKAGGLESMVEPETEPIGLGEMVVSGADEEGNVEKEEETESVGLNDMIEPETEPVGLSEMVETKEEPKKPKEVETEPVGLGEMVETKEGEIVGAGEEQMKSIDAIVGTYNNIRGGNF